MNNENYNSVIEVWIKISSMSLMHEMVKMIFKIFFVLWNLLLDVASNFSDFFLLFHFQGLKSRPKAWSLDFLWIVGVASPRLLLLGTPFAFLTEKNSIIITICWWPMNIWIETFVLSCVITISNGTTTEH